MQQHVLHARVQLRPRRRRRTQPAGVLAQCQADATGTRGGRLARLEHGPDDLAGQAEPIEPLALIILHARDDEILLPDARGKVLALEQLDGGEHARRTGEPVIGMQVMAPQEHRRELLGRRHRTRQPARVHLPPLHLFQHRYVDVLRARRAGEELAAAHDAARGEPIQGGGGLVAREAVTLREPVGADGTTRAQQP